MAKTQTILIKYLINAVDFVSESRTILDKYKANFNKFLCNTHLADLQIVLLNFYILSAKNAKDFTKTYLKFVATPTWPNPIQFIRYLSKVVRIPDPIPATFI